jgi:hypothetical protein
MRLPTFVFIWMLLAASISTGADSVIYSAQSGKWSSPATWQGGKVPAAGARVMILPDHAVTYDVNSDDVIRAINIAGTLTFSRDRDTRLNVGLIKIEANEEYSEEGFDCDHASDDHDPAKPHAALEVGSPTDPIPAQHTATIRLHQVEGLDPASCPAIVCCGGRMDFHGAPLTRTWFKLAASAKKGDATIIASEDLKGWKAGDQIIITATAGDHGDELETETRVVKAIDGTTITLDQPLAFTHRGEGELRGEVANLSRNVVVESANPAGVRGHTMYHRNSAGSISYAEFRHLGKKDVLGRYSLHFHLVGNTMRGSSVIGASIWDSHNRWLTIHGTNYLVVRDCVGFGSIGHGFFLEDGTEVFNVLDRNLAVQAREGKRLRGQVLPFDANEGAGFWWANSLNTFTRNVTCENERYGYRFEATPSSALKIDSFEIMQPDGTYRTTDIRTLPFVRFAQNEAHCDGLYGINLGEGVNRVGPDTRHPFVLRDTKIWEVHYAFRVQSPSVLVERMHIENTAYGVYHPHFQDHVYRDWKVLNVAAEPFNRGHDDDSKQYGKVTVDGITFTAKYWGGNMPFIQISDDNLTGEAESHFRNVQVLNRPEKNGRLPLANLGGGPRPQPKTEKGVPYYFHDYYGPGKHAKVMSVKAQEIQRDGLAYRSEPPLTGDESRVAETSNVQFPKLLDPVDDLPPATVVTSAMRNGDKLLVQGVVTDNGEIAQVTVNGKAARLDTLTGDFAIELPADTQEVVARSQDKVGNVEALPHVVAVQANSVHLQSGKR